MKHYSNDPYWLTVKYPCTCEKCGKSIGRGEQAFYYPRTKKMQCAGDSCGGQSSRDFAGAAMDEAAYCGQSW